MRVCLQHELYESCFQTSVTHEGIEIKSAIKKTVPSREQRKGNGDRK